MKQEKDYFENSYETETEAGGPCKEPCIMTDWHVVETDWVPCQNAYEMAKWNSKGYDQSGMK